MTRLCIGPVGITAHKRPQFFLHFGSDFSTHSDVEHESRIARCQAPELGGRQALITQKPFNQAFDVHNVSSKIDPDLLARIS